MMAYHIDSWYRNRDRQTENRPAFRGSQLGPCRQCSRQNNRRITGAEQAIQARATGIRKCAPSGARLSLATTAPPSSQA
jgi:hypothetical protein